jgi:hypothetical protein
MGVFFAPDGLGIGRFLDVADRFSIFVALWHGQNYRTKR